MATAGKNAVIMADECLHEFLSGLTKDTEGHHLFEFDSLLKINEELKTDEADMLGLSALFGSIGTGIASRIVDNRLVVKNHFLWSTGEFQNLDGEYDQISVGVFGHIFTFNKEDLDKAIDNAL